MRKFRIHVLGLPHTRTNEAYTACAFTQKALQFCKMMHERGHYIIHYGVEGSDPECDENVVVLDDATFKASYGVNDLHKDLYIYGVNYPAYDVYVKNTIAEISKRKQPLDIILPFWGIGQKPISDAFPDLISIEPGIGYVDAAYTDIRAYESYMMMALQAGLDNNHLEPSFYRVVIPPFFDLKDFEYNWRDRTKGDDVYFAFLGRIGDHKGVNIAMDVCRTIGAKLKVAGQPTDYYAHYKWPDFVEFIGHCNKKQRTDLFKGAVATFVASRYMEPFGYVQVESLLCGTPIITTDWGAFPEVNINGVTGYRCRVFDDFVNAALNCLEGKIKSIDCRKRGEDYRFEVIAPQYEKFFQDVYNLYSPKGWYTLNEDTLKRLK